MEEKVRLQKYLSRRGIASRRKAEELIVEGRVKVNGKVVRELGSRVGKNDIVEVDGEIVGKSEKRVYIMLNKPAGYITSVRDQFNRRTVLDLIKGVDERIYPVGRLDYNTSGLLILTNDGELTFKLTHPSCQVNKVYLAEVEGVPDREDIKKFRTGLVIDGFKTAPAKMEVVENKGSRSLVKITLHEGKNRQVRRMCEAIGHKVLKLKRIEIGNLMLGRLAEGGWRHLTEAEVESLKNPMPRKERV